MLFPITLAPIEEVKKWKKFDADRGTDSAREVRKYFIPDFSRWKEHDSYQAAFQRLVKDLKAAGRWRRFEAAPRYGCAGPLKGLGIFLQASPTVETVGFLMARPEALGTLFKLSQG